MLGILTTLALAVLAILLILNLGWEIVLAGMAVVTILALIANEYCKYQIGKEDKVQNKSGRYSF